MDRINGAGTIDIGGGRRGFVDENLPLGTEGTEVNAEFLNMIQEEMMKVIEAAGLAGSNVDWTQLWQAIGIIGSVPSGAFIPVISRTLADPPAAPASGDKYLIPAGATGEWAGNEEKIAIFNGLSWVIVNTPDGHCVGLPDGMLFIKKAAAYERFAPDATDLVKGLVSLNDVRATVGGEALTASTTVKFSPVGLSLPESTITTVTLTNFVDDGQADWAVSGNTLVCQRAGRYIFLANLGGVIQSNGTVMAFTVGTMVNGVQDLNSTIRLNTSVVNQAFGGASEIRDFAVGDVIYVWGYQASGATKTIQFVNTISTYRLTAA
ncbi:MAG: DUF2793 domain-containing protein [Rhizobium sp.]